MTFDLLHVRVRSQKVFKKGGQTATCLLPRATLVGRSFSIREVGVSAC